MTKSTEKPLKDKAGAPKTAKKPPEKVIVKKKTATAKKPAITKKDDMASNQARLVADIQRLSNVNKTTKKQLLLSTLILLMGLLIVGYSGFYWYQQSIKLSKNNLSNEPLQQLTKQFESLEKSAKKTNQLMTQQLEKLQKKSAELSSIDTVKFLVEDAIWLLDIRQRPKQSAQVLQRAIVILSSENNPKNRTQQITLTKAAADLSEMKSPNTLRLIQTLGALNLDIVALKIADNQLENAASTIKKSDNFLDNVWEDVKNLVKVQRSDVRSVGKLLSDEAKSLSPTLLKLQIQYLQLAALSKNAVEFKSELNRIIELTNNLFDTEHANTLRFLNVLKNLQSEIIELDKIPVSMTPVRALLNQ